MGKLRNIIELGNPMPKLTYLATLIVTLLLPLGQHALGEDAKKTEIDTSALEIQERDIIMGKEDAPVTIIEYASLSCGHCASFHGNILPALKKDYIDTGKAKFIFRSFPLNAPALRGSMLVRCVPEGDFYTFIKVLFDQQKAWAFNPNYVNLLGKIARLGGMHHENFKKCMENEALETELIEAKKVAVEKLGVRSTPTVFVGEEQVPAHDLDAIKKAIEAKLAS